MQAFDWPLRGETTENSAKQQPERGVQFRPAQLQGKNTETITAPLSMLPRRTNRPAPSANDSHSFVMKSDALGKKN
jgi:hypothetical protein